MNAPLSLALLAVIPTASLTAQSAIPLLVEGEFVPGLGEVLSFENLRVNDVGQWLASVSVENGGEVQVLTLIDGQPFAALGEPLVTPAGATLGLLESVQINTFGQVSSVFRLNDAPSGVDMGVFLDKTLLLAPGDPFAAPDLPPDAEFQGFDDADLNAVGTHLVFGLYAHEGLTPPLSPVLMRIQGDTAETAAVESVVKRGDLLAGQVEPVAEIPSGRKRHAINDAGNVLFVAKLAGDAEVDDVVYLDGTLLAQEDSPSPIPGRSWASLSDFTNVDLNDAGSHLYSGLLKGDGGSNLVIIKDGAKFVQEGDLLASIAPYAIDDFGYVPFDGVPPLHLGNTGQVLWYGTWYDDAEALNRGIFLDHDLLIHEGVTELAGQVIDIVFDYELSPNGRFVIADVELAGGARAAGLLDLGYGAVEPLLGCTPALATLSGTGGEPLLGGSFELTLGGPPSPGAIPFLGFATQPVAGYPACGLSLGGAGELLIDFLPPNPVLVLAAAASTGAPTAFQVNVPGDPSLNGVPLFAQGLFADPSGASPEALRLSNGASVLFGL